METPDVRHRFPGAFYAGFLAAVVCFACAILAKHYYWDRTKKHLFLTDGGEWDEQIAYAISLPIRICAARWRHRQKAARRVRVRTVSPAKPEIDRLPVVVRSIAGDNPAPPRE